MLKYYFQDLPEDIKKEVWEGVRNDEELNLNSDEEIDDYINRRNRARTITDWQNGMDN